MYNSTSFVLVARAPTSSRWLLVCVLRQIKRANTQLKRKEDRRRRRERERERANTQLNGKEGR